MVQFDIGPPGTQLLNVLRSGTRAHERFANYGASTSTSFDIRLSRRATEPIPVRQRAVQVQLVSMKPVTPSSPTSR